VQIRKNVNRYCGVRTYFQLRKARSNLTSDRSYGRVACQIASRRACFLTPCQPLIFLRSAQMVTNQKVLSNRASGKSRVSRVGSIMTALSIALQKGGTRTLLSSIICEGLCPLSSAKVLTHFRSYFKEGMMLGWIVKGETFRNCFFGKSYV
jgi:hypothetical protein